MLEENELYYEAVLDKLRVDLVVTEEPTTTQASFSDSEQSDNESSALLRPRTQIQLHSEAQPKSVPRAREIIGICFGLIICFIIGLSIVVSTLVYRLLYQGKYLKCYKITYLFLYGLFAICISVLTLLILSMTVSSIKKTGLFVVMFILVNLLGTFFLTYFCGMT